MNRFGFVRITCASTKVSVGNPRANATEILRVLEDVPESDIVLFPELGLTAYTCADLFGQQTLLDGAVEAATQVVRATAGRRQLVVVGAPVRVRNSLFNCALVIWNGTLLGVVPKQFIPNYKEFYERRWFSSANGVEPREIELGGQFVPFGIDLLFQAQGGALVGVEICEDLWMPIPPSSVQAIGGANILLNLSASNETIGKCRYRTDLVVGQSGSCIAAYAYSSAGPSESTTDLVFGGHCLIAENGKLLEESPRVGNGQPMQRGSYSITRDVDIELLQTDRRVTTSFDDCQKYIAPFRKLQFQLSDRMNGLKRYVFSAPFVPKEDAELHRRCAEIFGIQCAGLAQRIERLPAGTNFHIGISGGLDSTLALLVAVKTCDLLGYDRRRVHGLTMPGFGTTARTKTNALALMNQLGISSETIDICELVLRTFQVMGCRPFGIDCRGIDVQAFKQALASVPLEKLQDLTFENVQARVRTLLLMSRGFVVGTADLSELALGWSTYNADHMSMYNPNCSIPKTLVTFLVKYVAQHDFAAGPARETLLSIAATTISPELLPAGPGGEIEQSTEATLGPYELHDFFLFHAVRCGYAPEKILFLSEHAEFSQSYSRAAIEASLKTFITRFFSQQFKRSCVPDGPKVGTVSLSPRGDWRMPSDADAEEWLRWC
jgi:NAD+ synthase (glutamine-hydrolysing)